MATVFKSYYNATAANTGIGSGQHRKYDPSRLQEQRTDPDILQFQQSLHGRQVKRDKKVKLLDSYATLAASTGDMISYDVKR